MGKQYGYIKKNNKITHDVSRTKSQGLVLVYLTIRVVQPIGWKKKLNPEIKPQHVQHVLGTFKWRCAEIAARHVPNSKHVA